MIGGGWWSDRVGRKIAMLVPAVSLVIWAPIFFSLVHTENMTALGVGVCVGALLHGMLAGPEAAWITELFPTKYRFAGSSLVFQARRSSPGLLPRSSRCGWSTASVPPQSSSIW